MRRLTILMVFIFNTILLSLALPALAEVAAMNYLCKDPQYFCTQVRSGENWETLFTDPETREMVRTINRRNSDLYPGMIIAIPRVIAGKNANDYAPFPQQRVSTGNKVLVFDPAVHAWAAYDEQGDLVRWGPAAGGKDWCPDINSGCRTPAGKYTMYDKRDAGCFSRKFPVGIGGAPMPYCMFFHGGYAFHASPQVPGYHASHGCVRIFYEDARWLNQEFVDIANSKEAKSGTQVIVLPYYHSTSKPLQESGEES